MNGIPDPYAVGTRLIVRGTQVIVTDRAPNADGWKYIGHPVDLAGAEKRFSHEEALPVRPPAIAPAARGVLTVAGLDPDQFDQALAQIEADEEMVRHIAHTSVAATRALDDLLSTVRDIVHGHGNDDDLRQAYITYDDATR